MRIYYCSCVCVNQLLNYFVISIASKYVGFCCPWKMQKIVVCTGFSDQAIDEVTLLLPLDTGLAANAGTVVDSSVNALGELLAL